MRISCRCSIVSLFVFALAAGPSFAQTGASSAFVLSPVGDGALAVTGAALVGGSLWLDTLKPAPELRGLDAAAIPPFDSLHTTSYSKPLSLASDGVLVAALALPLALAPGLSPNDLLTVGTMYAETLAIAYGYKETIKALVVRYRPYAYSPDAPPELLASAEVEDSMPSGHTTAAFAAAVFAGYTFGLLYPSSPWQAAVWGGGLGLAGATAALRVMSGNHFPSDVLVGAAGGALVGFLVPYLHTGAVGVWSGAAPRAAIGDSAGVVFSMSALAGLVVTGAAALIAPGMYGRARAALEPVSPRLALDPASDRIQLEWSIAN